MTPHEVLAYRQNGSAPNTPGWELRVVPNKFPALQVEGALARARRDRSDERIGAHEVIIETPHHDARWRRCRSRRSSECCGRTRRILDLKRDGRLRYILVFKNHGAAAGATLEHTHSQLIALPIVPDFLREELSGARRHFEVKERCVFCDVVHEDLRDGRRIIQENADIVALAPYAPRFAFETWLLPRRHGARFEEAPRHEYESLARMVKSVLQRMDRALETPPYNLIVHASPFSEETGDFYHWHVEIMPKLTRVAGFEWGTGFYLNPTSPEEAAQVLRAAKI